MEIYRAAIMTLKLQQRRHCIDRLPLLQLVFEQGPPITSSCFTPGQEWKRLIFKNSWELDPKTVSTAKRPAICAKDSHHHQSFPNKVPVVNPIINSNEPQYRGLLLSVPLIPWDDVYHDCHGSEGMVFLWWILHQVALACAEVLSKALRQLDPPWIVFVFCGVT